MSWPSFYGYKYTPIGLRQREVKDETGKMTFSTTVHLPEGGYLLDIERRINPDGSCSKTESCHLGPSLPLIAPTMEPSITPRAIIAPTSDIERQADDIIANFRARQGTGMEQIRQVSKQDHYNVKQTRAESSYSAKEEYQQTSSRHLKRQARNFMNES